LRGKKTKETEKNKKQELLGKFGQVRCQTGRKKIAGAGERSLGARRCGKKGRMVTKQRTKRVSKGWGKKEDNRPGPD